MSNEEIKNVTLSYCVDNLTKQHKDASVVEGLELKKYLHNMRMDVDSEEGTEEGFDITEEDFNEVMTKFGSKKTKSYDFLLKSGKEYKKAVHNLCREMIMKK